MNILLAGASGFIGRNVILQAREDWRIVALYRNDASFPEFISRAGKPNVTAAECDLADPGQVATLFQRYPFDWDCCLYLAAKVDIPWSVSEPKQDLLANVPPLLNLLEILRTRRFVYFSSGAVYDGLNGEVGPLCQLAPTLPYAISKLTCERYVHFYSHRKRSIDNYLIVRFFGAYGPYEPPHKIYTRLIRAFALEGKNHYKIYGDGQNLIDAMYVDDAVDAIARILTGCHWNDTINLAGGQPLTIEALVREIALALGRDSITIEKEGTANESNQFWGSTSEMRDIFGFQPKVQLSDGIRRFREFHNASRSNDAS
jgi:UDP-glucuronate 4-epimerase